MRFPRSTRLLLSGAALVAALCLVGVPAAHAHDDLVSSSPSEGESLAEAPTEIRLEFTTDVMEIGALVLVVDADGTDWVSSASTVDGPFVVTTLDQGMPVAGYEVRWRVIGEDGHPISGVIPFTIGDAEPLTRPVAATPEPVVASTVDQNTGEDQSLLRTILFGVLGALVAASAFLIFLLFRQRSARAAAGPGPVADDRPATSRKAQQ
ncbi:methionine-rich copper-binding protein CopC [Microbacteriaceae bacterium SG_E_30_P1]|uniref:Methionine-rich copper-binding protein CopC n=1 Tax=Antiquaquibacter oligotrophicus TaxID=2880260 RepID=A0ABT6KKA2_9MICO|nr:copper resistance CopC family protein [Antiquaquibacter oligotrophicus]MDH6179858.1 methionine-rich copper-binding protein CopC [Antiquaquibacter oligotrophicus]UDF14381.1 copper resistance protein CopC [Antiquaquibacter oligotrophicus]